MKTTVVSKMNYGIFSANTWLYHDSNPEDGAKKVEICCAGNSRACVQLLCHTKETIQIEWQGQQELTPEINRLIPVTVEKNCSDYWATVVPQGTPAPYAARQAPFQVYDPMEPVSQEDISPDQANIIPLYLIWNTGNTCPGEHKGTLKISQKNNTYEIPVTLKIYPVKIPVQGKLRVTNWYNLKDMATFHNTEPWSEEHWEMIKKYGQAMRSCRQTDFMTHACLAKRTVTSGDEYIFDFTNTKRFIELFLSLGFTHIEGETIVCRNGWDSNEFLVRWGNERYPALSPEGMKLIESYYTQWYRFLQENGWTNIATQHVADEPHDGCSSDYCKLAEIFKKLLPGIPLIDAVETVKIENTLDIYVPKSIGYTNDREGYDKLRENSVCWYYTCCFPGGTYLNRLLDHEVIRTRYLHWANYIYNFTGYLHWGFSYYHSNGTDPYVLAGDHINGHMGQILPAGDTHIVYPKGKMVLKSVRLEAMRAGIEDYELLMILSEKSPEKARELAVKCVRSFTDYTKDISVFEQTYGEILEALY